MMKTLRPLAGALGALVFMTASPVAQAQQGITQQQAEEMIRELRAMRMILEKLVQPQQQAPRRRGQDHYLKAMRGPAGRPLTMVEFTDLQCPFCRQFTLTAFDELKRNWIDTGKLRFISRDFPLDFHAQAMPAARAARCAGEQGKFWEMRLALVRNANLLTSDYIAKTGADLKLDTKAFAACSASTKYDAEIQAEMQEGLKIPVTGTPTFILGRTTAAGIEGPVLVGALPYVQFDAKLRSLLDGPVR